MKPLDNIKIRIFGPLILYLLGIFIFRLQIYLDGTFEVRMRYATVGLFYHFICWHIARWVIMKVQMRYPGLDLLRKRLKILLILVLPVLTLLAFVMRYYTHQLILGFTDPIPSLNDFIAGVSPQLFFHGVYISVYEGIYAIHQWRKTFEEKEVLTKLQWQTRFDSLKNQINPHFLFNSLNTLSALIHENPKKAEAFVDEMSKVYRHLLQSNENALVPLAEELNFIDSYFHLLKTRFDKGLFLSVDIPPQYLDYQIPPLTLQILLENAVKHNIVSDNKPLTIHFKVNKTGDLIVENNIQPKNIKINSTGFGLANLVAKYEFLSNKKVQIIDENKDFKVVLPLIKSN